MAEIKIVGKYGSTAETAASERSSRLLNSMINLQPKCICENISKEVITSMAINKILADVTVTEEEVKAYYEGNKEAFGQPATVSAKHILVETEEEAKKVAEQLNKIRNERLNLTVK